MFEYAANHFNEAKIIKSEIDADIDSSWYDPGDKNHIYFSDSRIRFVNRNLNYFYFDNMLVQALQNNYAYNPHYTETLNFCNSVRTVTNEQGPFGKMCLWRVKPFGKILPHIDAWAYHRNINRYFISVSDHSGTEVNVIIGGQTVNIEQGTMFNFNPSTDMHEFKNNTDRPWDFVAFDYWNPARLLAMQDIFHYTADTVLNYADGYGNRKNRYLSKE